MNAIKKTTIDSARYITSLRNSFSFISDTRSIEKEHIITTMIGIAKSKLVNILFVVFIIICILPKRELKGIF